jgi:hypothetical protein
MSEEKITLELVGARVMSLTADVRDLRERFDGAETRLARSRLVAARWSDGLRRRKNACPACWRQSFGSPSARASGSAVVINTSILTNSIPRQMFAPDIACSAKCSVIRGLLAQANP